MLENSPRGTFGPSGAVQTVDHYWSERRCADGFVKTCRRPLILVFFSFLLLVLLLLVTTVDKAARTTTLDYQKESPSKFHRHINNIHH